MLRHHELAHDDHLFALVIARILVPIGQFVAIRLTNQHRRDPDSATCAIVAHQNLVDHLGAIVDDDGDGDAEVLHVAHFLDEAALATVGDHKGTDVIRSRKLGLIFIKLFA